MSGFPSPARRADWWATQRERDHRPAAHRVGPTWRAGCGCGCERGEDGTHYPTWEDAMNAARHGHKLAEHGPGIGQELT